MKLSVITINYNNKSGLERTFKSIINQSCQDFEYIVIDGGSTDGSRDLIEKYKDFITYWVSEPDKGIYNAMNKGIQVAKGEYLLFINSGDILYDATVVKNILPLLHTNSIIAGGLVLSYDNWEELKPSRESISFELFIDSTVYHPSTFIRRSCFDQYGYYDESLKIVSDWKWFMLVLAKHNESYSNIANIISCFYTDGISSHSDNRSLIHRERETVLNKYFPLFISDYNKFKVLQQEMESIKRSRIYKLFLKIKSIKNRLTAAF